MELLKIILLAIIQGISEILPISSSGHLILFKYLFQLESKSLTLEIFLHFGSLIAILIYYFKDIKNIIFDSFLYVFNKEREKTKANFSLLIKLLISTLITGVVGFFFSNLVKEKLSSIKFLPIFFLLTSIILFFSNKFLSKKNIDTISIKDSIIIGFFQLIGIIPGVSRSGITMFGCRFRQIDNNSSFKYSYLLFIPISFASFILELIDLTKGKIQFNFPFYYYIISILISFIFTFLSMILLSKIIKKDKHHYFSYYLIILSFSLIIITLSI